MLPKAVAKVDPGLGEGGRKFMYLEVPARGRYRRKEFYVNTGYI
jgi:hypothetical protein